MCSVADVSYMIRYQHHAHNIIYAQAQKILVLDDGYGVEKEEVAFYGLAYTSEGGFISSCPLQT